jgi:hypothetical protein
LFQKRDYFACHTAGAEIVAYFVKGATETGRGVEGSKTTHRIVALFDAAVVLFQTIIEILVRPMLNIVAYRLADSSRIEVSISNPAFCTLSSL